MHVELLVEEPSMEAFLHVLLPRLLPEACSHEIRVFRGKSDLRRKLADRLRAYARWLPDDWRIVVLVGGDVIRLRGGPPGANRPAGGGTARTREKRRR